MIVVRLPQANIEAKNPAISISCFVENRCGMQMGSSFIKNGCVYSSTFLSKNFFNCCTAAPDCFLSIILPAPEISLFNLVSCIWFLYNPQSLAQVLAGG